MHLAINETGPFSFRPMDLVTALHIALFSISEVGLIVSTFLQVCKCL
jgi:hypothetical protein